MRYPLSVIFKTFRYTLMTALLGALCLGLLLLFEVEVFESLGAVLARFETWEADEWFLLCLPVCVGYAMDMLRCARRHRQEIALHQTRLAELRATTVTVNDIMLNFLHDLQSFRLQAEEENLNHAASLQRLDEEIQRTAAQLRHIRGMEKSRPENHPVAQTCGPR